MGLLSSFTSSQVGGQSGLLNYDLNADLDLSTRNTKKSISTQTTYAPVTTNTDSRSMSLIYNSPNSSITAKKEGTVGVSPNFSQSNAPDLSGSQSGAKVDSGLGTILLIGGAVAVAIFMIGGKK